MIPQSVYYDYLNNLLQGNKRECSLIIKELLDENVSPKEIYTELFQKSLYRVGQMWEKNRSSVATEHLATKITETLLNIVSPQLRLNEKTGHTVIVTCIDKEFHEIGAKIVADFFELNGWESYFLGANTPCTELIKMIDEKKPDVVGISNTFYINIPRLLKSIDNIKSHFPDQKIIVGGQSLSNGQAEILNRYDNVRYIGSIDELEDYIINFK